MDSINSFLLSIFAKNQTFGRDVESFFRRYQILSLIYVNLAETGVFVVYNFIIWFFYDNPAPFMLLIVCLPFSLLSFLFIRLKKIEASVIMLLIVMHSSNFIGSYSTNSPMAALYAVLLYPHFTFSLSSSYKVHLLNAVLCGAMFLYSALKINDMFRVTLTDEQSLQISRLIAAGIICVSFTILVSFIQKAVEMNIWKLAQENHVRSENLTKDVVEAMEVKDSFVSMLSHEIRNPLNSLKGSIDYLSQVVKNPEHLKVLKNAKLSGEILLNLVSNVLDAAKLKSDKMELAYMETDFVEIVKKVFIINSENLSSKELSAEAFIDKNVPKLLWIDPSRSLQILMNLFSNAIKFTRKGGKIRLYISWCPQENNSNSLLSQIKAEEQEELQEISRNRHSNWNQDCDERSHFMSKYNTTIFEEFNAQEKENRQKNLDRLNTSIVSNCSDQDIQESSWKIHWINNSGPASHDNPQKQGFLKVQISDNGCGIAEDQVPKLFGMFEQVTRTARSDHGGTGLGLWICKQLCRKMNGDIAIYSKVGKGTSFVFYVPVNNDRLNNSITNWNRVNRDEIRALVVDDYSVNRYLHKLLLEQEGVRVVLANNGKEAYEKFISKEEDYFNFILTDVQMPEMDGFTSIQLIRKWEQEKNRKKVAVYFVTGEYYNEEDVLSTFLSRGGVEDRIRCLRKPLDGDMIRRVVQTFKSR